MILVVGVNGTGKTTTIGKLASRLRDHGHSVVVAAADTFRAAADEQLEIWAGRAGADFVGSSHGADPAAVAFDAIEAAQARGRDVVIVDTAGRLHTQTNLMEELAKIRRVIAQRLDGAPHETLLVVDATTGQNGLQQARLFGDAVQVSGVALTKLDGSAKGGIAVAIAHELGLPVKLVGVGESLDDLQPFDAGEFARALVSADGCPGAEKVFLITGASSGIGEATARRAVEAGYRVVLGARSIDKLEALADGARRPEKAIALRCDVTEWADQQALVQVALERFGRLDVALANAGFGAKRGFLEETPEYWKSMVLTNVYGAALTIRATLPPLKESRATSCSPARSRAAARSRARSTRRRSGR